MAFYDFTGAKYDPLPAGLTSFNGQSYIRDNELAFGGTIPGNPRWIVTFPNNPVGAFKFRVKSRSGLGVARLFPRFQDQSNSVFFDINFESQEVKIFTYIENNFELQGTVAFTLEAETFYEGIVNDTGSAVELIINGQSVLTYATTLFKSSTIKAIGTPNSGTRYDDLYTNYEAGEVVKTAPIASLGANQNITTGIEFTADASGSNDPDGDALTYSYVLTTPVGSSATLADATTPSPRFTPDIDGEYTLTLTVNDGTEDSTTATQVLTSQTIQAGIAITMPEDFLVDLGNSVSLQCALSGDVTSSAWSITQAPTGSTATISNPNTNPASFTPDAVGLYEATMTAQTSSGTETDRYFFRVREAEVTEIPIAEITVNGEPKVGEKITFIARGKY